MSVSPKTNTCRLNLPAFSLIFILFTALGCGKDTQTSSAGSINTSCNPGSAAILIGDGFLVNLCGCQGPLEQPGTRYTLGSSTSLTCHLSSTQSVVFFYFTGAAAPHQILSTGSPHFVSSPIRFNEKDGLEVFPITFSNPGTYTFEDPYTRISGQFIVP